MNKELEAIKSAWLQGTKAKAEVMNALGRAKLAEREGRSSSGDWDVVMSKGVHGTEGEKKAEAVRLSDAYVEAHPEEFALYRDMDEDDLVRLLDTFRMAGLEEQVWRVQAWLFHRFEPKHVGGPLKSRIRLMRGR